MGVVIEMPIAFEHSPLQDAVAEIQFVGSQQWDWTIPGLLYERVMSQYPQKRQLNMLQFEIQPSEGKVQQAVKGGIARLQFLDSEGTAAVQVGENLLAVSHQRPYPGWATFRSQILTNFDRYRAVAQPVGVKRVGLRYVNRIEFPESPLNLADFFVSPPQPPDTGSEGFHSMLQQTLVSFREPPMFQRLTLGSAAQPSPSTGPEAFIVDIDVFSEAQASPGFDGLSSWLDTAHERLERAFLGSITHRTRSEILGESEYASEEAHS